MVFDIFQPHPQRIIVSVGEAVDRVIFVAGCNSWQRVPVELFSGSFYDLSGTAKPQASLFVFNN